MKKLYFSLITAILSFALRSLAMKNGYFELDEFKQFEQGELSNLSLSSKGVLKPVKKLTEYTLPQDVVWSILALEQDKLLLGLGNQAKLIEFQNGVSKEIFSKNGIAINSIISGEKGEVYFSILPGGTIYRVNLSTNKVEEFVKTSLEYIWTMVFVPESGVLVGGGRPSKVLLISKDGKIRTLIELSSEYILSIARGEDKYFYAGTTKPAQLVRFSLNGEYYIEHCFEQDEIKGLVYIEGKEKGFIVGVNQGIRTFAQPQPEQEQMPRMKQDEQEAEQRQSEQARPPRQGPPPGNAVVYFLTPGKGLRTLLTLDQTVILDIAKDKENNLYIATDSRGRVYTISEDFEESSIAYQLKSGMASTLALYKKELAFIGSGYPARLYKVNQTLGSSTYTSSVLDAGFISRFGSFESRGTGSIKFETRSGNTAQPGDSWSKWEPLGLTKSGLKVLSPPARYLQVKASFGESGFSTLESVRINYQSFNQAHYFRSLDVKTELPKDKSLNSKNRQPPQSAKMKSSFQPATTSITISWDIDNPDQDQLCFYLFYQKEGNKLWTPIKLPQPFTQNSYQWLISALEDGYYSVKVLASDELNNPPSEKYEVAKISEKFLIDTTKPEITKMELNEKETIYALAKDKTSIVMEAKYSIDGEQEIEILPVDMVFDEKEEEFKVKLSGLPRGEHTFTFQTCDEAFNCASKQIEFYLEKQ